MKSMISVNIGDARYYMVKDNGVILEICLVPVLYSDAYTCLAQIVNELVLL